MSFPHSELAHIARSIFPKAVIEEADNLDDVNSAIDIAVRPFLTIRIKVNMKFSSIIIEKYYRPTSAGFDCKTIFKGDVPANKDKTEPDFDFIENILVHHNCF